jgi:hypothetical protein
MNPPSGLSATPEQLVADGLNQQGFLLAQAVRNEIDMHIPNGSYKGWKCLTHEYSVTAVDGSQTRIDLVLQMNAHPGQAGQSTLQAVDFFLTEPNPIAALRV